jgi:hypothetical protein
MRRRTVTLGLGLSLVFAAAARAEFNIPVWNRCPNGAQSPVAAANADGATLIAWQDTQKESEACFRSVAVAAIGSASGGLAPLGPITAGERGELSQPTGAFLDRDGDGWVVGENAVPIPVKYYGWSLRTSGAWYAYRPTGGRFRHPVALPDWSFQAPLLAGDQAGATVIAWNTSRGADLAWGTPAGGLTKPVSYGRGLSIVGVGVDESGRALIVGYYSDPRANRTATEIVVITGRHGRFSRPRVIATRPRDIRRGFLGFLGIPVMAAGPDGQAVIAWASSFHPEELARGWDTIVYRHADGDFSKPARFASGFLQERGPEEEPNKGVVDGTGRALIISAGERGLWEVAVAANGRASPPRRILSPAADYPLISANALGATSILVEEGRDEDPVGPIEVLLGNTSGANRAPETIPLSEETRSREPLTIMSPDGIATVIWAIEPQWSQTPRENEEATIDALTIAPGSQPRLIAHGEPVP